MVSKSDMVHILAIDDRKEREAAIDALSDTDAKQMLKKLANITRMMHKPVKDVDKP